ncbi:exodeoxyribonuclease VII large subunit [Bartonella tamiae]|nr:exodeoxyribonuclease VII large subunit [Bartonella tamiae]
MSDFFTDVTSSIQQKPTTNATEFSVSEISNALKRTVEDAFGHVRVRGEITGFRGTHSSGHAYFALKDDKARMEAVIWRGVMAKLQYKPEEGMEVIAVGKLTTYPGSSKYQIVIENLEPAGAGALMVLLEQRKKKLESEGLFNSANKQLLPFMPRIIGVVTSPTGSVIRDIIHRISDRFPLHILVWPVRVQGEKSSQEVAHAVDGFNALDGTNGLPKPDVVIVARGGGSLEDLWGFNDEDVVRSVARSLIPVISAVGHETDWTLIDYAADVRAPTPTGAAEMAVAVKADLEATLVSLHARLKAGLRRHFDFWRQKLQSNARALPTPDHLFALPRRRFDEASSRLMRALEVNSDKKRQNLTSAKRAFSPRLIVNLTFREAQGLKHMDVRFLQALQINNEKKRQGLVALGRNLTPRLIVSAFSQEKKKMVYFHTRLSNNIRQIIEKKVSSMATVSRVLDTLSYENILQRGFALILDEKNELIKSITQFPDKQCAKVKFKDGEVKVVKAQPAREQDKNSKDVSNKIPKQGSLF